MLKQQSKMASSRSKKASKRSLSPNPILGSSSKRRRPITVSKILPFTKRWDFLIFYVFQPIISEDLDSPSSSPSSYTASDTASVYNTATNGQLLFKDPNFEVGAVARLQVDIESKSKRLFGVAQWQEHSPLTNATRVRLPAWEVCEPGLRSLSDIGGFLWVLLSSSPPPTKTANYANV